MYLEFDIAGKVLGSLEMEQSLLLPSRDVNKIGTYGIFKEKGARKEV